MPSRFPWSKNSSSQPFTADPGLDIPRTSSRQELYIPPRHSPLETGSYNPYAQQPHQSDSSFEGSSPPPTANSASSIPAVPQEQPVSFQPYEQQYPQRAATQKAHPQKKSLRSKLLGTQTSREESDKDKFARKRSVRRRDPVPASPPPATQQNVRQHPWQLDTQLDQQYNHGNFEPYSPDFDNAQIQHRDFQAHLSAQQGGANYIEYPPSEAIPGQPAAYTVLRPQLTEESRGAAILPDRPSFGSRPSSRVESRPTSHRSYENTLGEQQQIADNQQEPYQTLAPQGEYQQPSIQSSPISQVAPPSALRQQRQNQPADQSKGSTTSRESIYIQSSSTPPGLESSPDNTRGQIADMQRSQQVSQEAESRSRTPPPPRPAAEMSEAELNQVLKEHREMKSKYNHVKRQYFDKKEQVDALQNTLAHQRLTQSRTHWDDGEYVTRMTRLDGLISQLAFGMRKDWRVLPEWLQPYCNKDAVQVARQEMTAVGRAFVSRWLVDELFDKYFHPGLPIDMSENLKMIQRNIRDFAPLPHNPEEEEALMAKIVNWRLATVDGLQPILALPEANSHREALIHQMIEQLVQDLKSHMQQDPPPAGLEGGVQMVIELAVSILGSLPLESRDVNISYFTPGQPINTELMKIESGIPGLENPPHQPEGDGGAGESGVKGGEERGQELESETGNLDQDDRAKRGFLGLMSSGAKRGVSPQRQYGAKQGSQATTSQSSLPTQSGTAKDERVRMSVFFGLQNRGKTVLLKAPVFRV